MGGSRIFLWGGPLEKIGKILKQAGAELGQAQLLLGLLVGGRLGMLIRVKLALLSYQCFVRFNKLLR